eukprot:6458144-Amphidinium_carterae.1
MAGWTTATEQAIPVAPNARSSRPRRLAATHAAGAALRHWSLRPQTRPLLQACLDQQFVLT